MGPFWGAARGAEEAEASAKRRRYGASLEAPWPSDQGLLQVDAATKAESRAGSKGSLRSSALGLALLHGLRGKGSATWQEAGALSGHTEQDTQGALESSSTSVQLSLLGKAVSAEDRLRLKRRRVLGDPGLEQPCSQGALDAIAACRDVEVASAVAAWPSGSRDQVGRGCSSSSGPSGPC